MCTSGCGFITAILLSRWNSTSLSGTSCMFQKMSPSLLTEISMFSGFVCRAMLLSFGSETGIVCVTTGIVIRKMMSSTSITSTSGVVLIAETTSSSSPSEEPTFIAIASSSALRGDHRGDRARAHQHAVQVGAEAAHGLHRDLVAADEPVVAEHRRNGDRKTDRGHDQRFADRAGDLVDRRLAGDADRRQGVVDAPDGAEQADEGSRRADRGEEREAVLEPALDVVDAALDAHRHPRVVVDVLGERSLVVLAREDPRIGDEAERAAGLQPFGAL